MKRFPRYDYNEALSFKENRRLAIKLHEREGKRIEVYHEVGRQQVFSHYLFPTGATLGGDPLDHVQNPSDPPQPGWEHLTGDEYRATLARRVQYWQLRADRAEAEFTRLKEQATRRPSQEALTKLGQLADEVTHCRARQAVEDAVLHPPMPKRTPSREQLAAEGMRHDHLLRLRAKVMRTNLDATPTVAQMMGVEEAPMPGLANQPAVAPGRLLYAD